MTMLLIYAMSHSYDLSFTPHDLLQLKYIISRDSSAVGVYMSAYQHRCRSLTAVNLRIQDDLATCARSIMMGVSQTAFFTAIWHLQSTKFDNSAAGDNTHLPKNCDWGYNRSQKNIFFDLIS